jgi:hypothetical protein
VRREVGVGFGVGLTALSLFSVLFLVLMTILI